MNVDTKIKNLDDRFYGHENVNLRRLRKMYIDQQKRKQQSIESKIWSKKWGWLCCCLD